METFLLFILMAPVLWGLAYMLYAIGKMILEDLT